MISSVFLSGYAGRTGETGGSGMFLEHKKTKSGTKNFHLSSRMDDLTIIEIRPHRGGWQAREAHGVEPYYVGPRAKENALGYAQGRTAMRKGEIRIYDSAGQIEQTIPFDPSRPQSH